jgi:putative sigma-54 modulation protein
MRLQVKGRNVEVSDSIRRYAEDKLGKLERQLADPTQVELEIAIEHNPSIADNHIAEATIWTKGPTLRAREASASYEASIDQLVEKLERQVKRYREKRSRKETVRRANGHSSSDEPNFSVEQLEQMIVKSKQFDLQPLTPDEAALELELVGHDFFVFKNVDTGKTNVVYRRRAGAYGLIEPQTESL